MMYNCSDFCNRLYCVDTSKSNVWKAAMYYHLRSLFVNESTDRKRSGDMFLG